MNISTCRALATNFLASMQAKVEEFRKSATVFEKECDKGETSYIVWWHLLTIFLELKKSIADAKGACSKTVKTSKNLEKKFKKGMYKNVRKDNNILLA